MWIRAYGHEEASCGEPLGANGDALRASKQTNEQAAALPSRSSESGLASIVIQVRSCSVSSLLHNSSASARKVRIFPQSSRLSIHSAATRTDKGLVLSSHSRRCANRSFNCLYRVAAELLRSPRFTPIVFLSLSVNSKFYIVRTTPIRV